MSHTNKISSKKVLLGMLGSSILLGFFSQQSYAGAWVADKGKGYNKLSYNTYNADEFEGDNTDFGEFDSSSTTLYAEYGLGNNFGLFGSLSYQDLEQTDSSDVATTGNGFSDLELGVKYQWQAEPFVLTTSLLVKLPYLYDENKPLPTGNGQEDVEFKVLVGKSLYPYGYLGVEAGYRYRADAPSDEYRYLVEYGYSFNKNVYVRTKLDGILSAKNADDASSSQTGSLLLVPEFDLGKLEMTVGYNFDSNRGGSQWGLEFTYTDEIYGDNALQGETFSLGITRVF